MRAFLILALLAGCARDNTTRDGGVMDFDVGSVHFRMASGTARDESGVVGIYFTDQPDACLAITRSPVGLYTVLSLRIGATQGTAMVVPRTNDPGEGEAVGNLRVIQGGSESTRLLAVDGSITFEKNENGTTTVTAMDLGFDGVSGRVTTSGELTIPACD